jgi:DNA-binding LacI/PurR family transcriptional regulator
VTRAKKQPATSHSVARAGEVSQSVLSRAFTPNGKIAPEARKRVLVAARKLGCQCKLEI